MSDSKKEQYGIETDGDVDVDVDGDDVASEPVLDTTATVAPAIAPAILTDALEPVISQDAEPVYCSFPEYEKRLHLVMASFSGMLSPFASSIYYPSVNVLARDLRVSVSLINLTISTYIIFQGMAPSVTAAVSETYGRRPAYLLCFVLFLGANIGLALQDNYAALLVLRCLQSSGSSGTIALAAGVMSDLSTRAERGKYTAYINMGTTLGPSLAPVIGGLLSQNLGWRSIFWFLTIVCGVVGTVLGIAFRETNRSIVGNGSVPPPRWNRSLLQVIFDRRKNPSTSNNADTSTLEPKKQRVNPLTSIKVLRSKENFLLILYTGIQFAGYISVTSILSSQIHLRYGFDQVHIGLCYLPLGIGNLTSRWTIGILIDWNFRREAKKQGLVITKNKQQDISKFNTEVARLTIAFPLILAASCCILAYGWAMEYTAPLAVILVILFFIGSVVSGSFVAISTLAIDINRSRPASTAAASNLVRCTLAAGAVAVANPLINAIGIGWTSTLTVGVWALFSPLLIWVYRNGHKYRLKEEARLKAKEDSEKQRSEKL